ncbi:MAG: ABC transporter permease [Saprospiraceae bacterium]
MSKNNLKIAWRNLVKNKTFSFINIGGLAVGLTSCLLMILYIQNELNFEKFNKNADQVFRVAFSDYLGQGSFATTPIPIGTALKAQLPEVKDMTRVIYADNDLVNFETNQGFESISYADESVFNIFAFPLIEGDPNTALKEPNSIAISEKFAKKYFGNESPMNKILKIGSGGALNSTVKAVFKNLPQNAHLQFNCLVSFSTLSKLGTPTTLWRQMPRNYTYIQLNDLANSKKLSDKFESFVRKNAGDDLIKESNSTYSLMLQPIRNIHLQSHISGERPGAGSMTSIYLFAAITFIILLIAAINFINFAIAHAIKRVKEIGVRKVIGAQRWQLISQFLTESLIIYFTATLLSFLLAQLLLPYFNEVSGGTFVFKDILQPLPLTIIMTVGILSGIIAGIFPAWSVSRLPSVQALKGKITSSSQRSVVRKTLVTLQFTASIILIVASIVVYRQMQYARKEASINQADQLIVFPMNGKLEKKNELLKTELLQNSSIVNVSVAANVPGFTGDGWPIQLTENSPPIKAENYVTDDDYLETTELILLAGRKLDAGNASDAKENFIINETAAHALGFHTPQEAIGKQLLWGGDEKKRGIIAGVVKDFHITSLHEKIAPAVIQFKPYAWMSYHFMLVKLRIGNINSTIDFIKKAVAGVDPNWLMDYKYFDENFIALHKKDEQQGKIFFAFAIIAVLISCLGLLGLAIYSTQQRIKEIGIRKTLGASIGGILYLLSKDLVQLIIIAAFLAFPIAWWLMHNWLQNFAYRTDISWWIFLVSGVLVIVISLFTVSYQSIMAALMNPVRSLKTE